MISQWYSAILMVRCRVQLSSEKLSLAANGNKGRDPPADIMRERVLICGLHWVLTCEAQGTIWKRSRKDWKSQSRWRTSGRHGPLNQLNWMHMGPQRLKGSVPGFLSILLHLLAWCFCGRRTLGAGVSLTLACPWHCFPTVGLPCPASTEGLLPGLSVSCFVLIVVSWRPALLW